MKGEVEIEKGEMVSEWKIDGYIAPTTRHHTVPDTPAKG